MSNLKTIKGEAINRDLNLMKKSKLQLCPSCKYSAYDAINEKGWNCLNKESDNYTNDYSLDISIVKECKCFKFALENFADSCRQIIKENDKKAQTTLI